MTHHAWPDKDMCAHTVVVHVQTIQYILYIIFPCTSLHHHRSDHFKWMTRQGHVHFKLICLNMIASHCCSELWPNSSGSFWHSCIAIANYVSCSFYYRLCTCTEHLPNWAYKQHNFLGERWDITVSHPIHFPLWNTIIVLELNVKKIFSIIYKMSCWLLFNGLHIPMSCFYSFFHDSWSPTMLNLKCACC